MQVPAIEPAAQFSLAFATVSSQVRYDFRVRIPRRLSFDLACLAFRVSKDGAAARAGRGYCLPQISAASFPRSQLFLLLGAQPVSAEPDVAKDEEGHDEADRQPTSVKVQRSKEVAAPSKERRPQPFETVVGSLPAVIQSRSPRPAGESKSSSARAVVAKEGSARSKPFSMSYDGMTQAEYIQYLRDRRLR